MAAAVAALAAVVPLALADGDASPRRVLDMPEQEIGRDTSSHEWPFSVDRGSLTCVDMNGQRIVIFSEPWRTDVPQEFGDMTLPRSVIVSTNPLALFASVEDRDLYLPFDSLQTLILRLAPYEAIGTRLCDRGKPYEPPARQL